MADWKAMLPFLIPALTALAGGGAAEQAAKTAEATRLEDRVKALEAQQEILLGLVGCRVPD